MTKYRDEYEKEMAKELGAFQDSMQAVLRRSDAAVLTSATAIGAALPVPAPRRGLATRRGTVAPAAGNVSVTNTSAPTAAAASEAAPSDGAKPIEIPKPGDLTKGMLDNIAARLDKLQENVLKFPTDAKVGIEPTQMLEEKSRYLNHLHQLRRINTGDDLADMPGYGLYLVRMPVSLLPGPEVRKGKGAVVTVGADHQLSGDLLANTFRDVVIMDATYQLAGILNKLSHGVGFPPFGDPTICPPAAGTESATTNPGTPAAGISPAPRRS